MASDAAPCFFFVHVMKTGGTSFVSQMTTHWAPARSDAALARPVKVDAGRLARAQQDLDAVDVVGVNEEFAAFVSELRQRFGWWADGAEYDARANVSSEPWDASDALRARIARESANDQSLYEHARELIAARAGA